jgi:hypothetical protein
MCLLHKDKAVFLVYVDDGILISEKQEKIDIVLQTLPDIFKISVEGTLSDCIGVAIERTGDNEYHFYQPNIINSILKELILNEDTKELSTPALSSVTGTGKKSKCIDCTKMNQENTKLCNPVITIQV